MRTPITYYGGKQRLTKTIVSMIPPHKVYIEPFFGGVAVFFAKQPSYLEVINDINDNVVTFYRVCQNEAQFQELHAKIQSTLFSEALFLQAKTIWNVFRKDMPMTVANLRIKERGANSRRKEELLVFNYELPSLFEEV